MRRISTLLFVLLLCPALSFGTEKYQGWCSQGGATVTTSGLQSSTFVLRSYKTCTITVYQAGTLTLATLYSNSSNTPLANPFTNQNTTTGQYYFYTDPANYDIQFAATGLATYTLGDVNLGGSIWTRTSAGLIYPSTTTDHVAIGTSANNGYNLDVQGTANVAGVSTFGSTGQFSVSAIGDLTKINNIAYAWPVLQGAASTVLTNDGAGNLTWVAGTGGGGGGLSCPGCTTNVLTKYNGANVVNSTVFDNGTTTTIGTLAGADSTNVRLEVEKDQNGPSFIEMRNGTSDTLAQAVLMAHSGASGGTNDISVGVTAAAFITANGIPASAGKIYTGVDTTAGLYVQTGAGPIKFQPGGTTATVSLTTGNTAIVGTTTLNGLTYTWPASQSAGTYLSTDGAGGLSWSVTAGSGGLTGSGTTGTVTIWSAGTAVGNSIITQVSSNRLTESGTAPAWLWNESDQGVDLKRWGMGADAHTFYFATRDDADTTGMTIFSVSRNTTTTADMVTYGVPVTVSINTSNSLDTLTQNLTAGASARSTFRATSDAGSIYMGVTSSTYTFVGSAEANQGFVATTDASVTKGIVFKTVAGNMLFRPSHGFVATPTEALVTMTSDYTFELTTASTGAVGASGTVRMRNNAGTLEVSQNGASYTGLVSGSGTTNLVTKFTGGATLGNSTIFDDGTSTSVGTNAATDDPTTIRFEVEKDQNNSTIMTVRNNTSGTAATSNILTRSGAHSGTLTMQMGVSSPGWTGGLGILASEGYLASGADATNGLLIQSGAGKIRFQVGGSSIQGAQFNTDGTVFLGDISSTDFGGVNTVSRNEVLVVDAATNAHAFAISLGGGTANLASSKSGSATAYNMRFYVASAVTAEFKNSGTDRSCLYINGSLRLLQISGGAVVDGGACP